MRNRIRHHATNALALALFFALYAFVGTMEFRWETERECGMVREEREWVPASCTSPTEISERMERIRSRGNEREWVAFGTDAR